LRGGKPVLGGFDSHALPPVNACLVLYTNERKSFVNREDRRAEQKLGKRRLMWLESESKHDKTIKKLITALEEYFDDDEIAPAKIFLADYLTQSGPLSEANEKDTIDQTCEYYGLETADGMFIMDIVEKILKENLPPDQEKQD
jgi:hypothetical protein